LTLSFVQQKDFSQLFMKFQRNINLSDQEWAPKEKKRKNDEDWWLGLRLLPKLSIKRERIPDFIGMNAH
jgi:hypothetical protein